MDILLDPTQPATAESAAFQPSLPEAAEHLGRWYWLRLAGTELDRPRPSLRMQHIDSDIQSMLGLSEKQMRGQTPATLARRIRVEAQTIEAQARRSLVVLRARLTRIAARVGLSTVEIDLLVFSAVAARNSVLAGLCRQITVLTVEEAAALLVTILDAPSEAIADSLVENGTLVANGLLLSNDEPSDFEDFFRAPKRVGAGLFAAEEFDDYLLGRTFLVAEAPQRAAEDYTHLATPIALIRSALTRGESSAHVLLVGAPGVGKTQLARRIACDLGWTAYEVRTDDGSGDPSRRANRFKHYALGCKLMADHALALVIFDEAEDVFVGDHWTHVASSEPRHKGWTNRLLETARVPTIWISNSMDRIDPAYLRRFDYVLEMRTPPRSVRRRLLAEATNGSGASAALIERIAESEDFTPADADRIARMLPRAISEGLSADVALRELASFRPDGVRRTQFAAPRSADLPFRLDWINVDTDLPQLIEGLRRRRSGTLGFFGPPGTGKTELARHLARELDRPLMLKKASDLLSPYIGQTERLIAQAFESAAQDEAVLLIDEVDSFLRDRGGAQHSWEVTQVNELLAQLDAYSGIAVLATNYGEALDRAVMRRLDAKLTFDCLRPEHAWDVFRAGINAIGLAALGDDYVLAQKVRGHRGIAFGDIACVMRRWLVGGVDETAEALYLALIEEVRRKNGSSRTIGFCTSAAL